MFNAASFDSGWDFWVLALLAALLLPQALPVRAKQPPRGALLFAPRPWPTEKALAAKGPPRA